MSDKQNEQDGGLGARPNGADDQYMKLPNEPDEEHPVTIHFDREGAKLVSAFANLE